MRFFRATGIAGPLHLLDILGVGGVEARTNWLHDEWTVDLLGERLVFEKVRTVEELDAALETSRRTLSINLFVSEQSA